MSKREKIILVVAGMAVLVGLAFFILDSSGGSKGAAVVVGPLPTAALRQEISGDLPKLRITDQERAGALAINRPWEADPFYLRRSAEAAAELAEDAPELLFVYTGYLEMGGTRMAIINGQEFHEREALDIRGYRLQRIYPNRVLIESDRRDTPVVIPYQEAEGTLQLPGRRPSW